jgi:hypothetical protein
VFDPSLAFKKSFPGNLYGLAKGEGGEVYTIQHTPYSLCIRILYPEAGDLVWEKKTNDMGNRPTGNIITAATHHLPAIESVHLFEKGGCLYISDAFRCQILRLILETKTWSSFDFYGRKKGKLKHPAGLLVDDVGNILVADNGRGSLCIFSQRGVFFEELRLKEIRRPLDIIWQGRTLLVACVGSNSRQKEIN